MEYGKKIQIHNFMVWKQKVGKASYIRVSTVAGDWTVSYRDDSFMFLTIDMADESQYEGLYGILVGMYGACNTVDFGFTKDLFDALDRLYERLKAQQKPATEEEDRQALNEVKAIYKLSEGDPE